MITIWESKVRNVGKTKGWFWRAHRGCEHKEEAESQHQPTKKNLEYRRQDEAPHGDAMYEAGEGERGKTTYSSI